VTFRSAVPGIPVSDLAKALDFYEHRLGFRRLRGGGDSAVLARSAIELRISLAEPRVAGTGGCRVHVDGLAALFDEYRASEAVPAGESIVDQPWGRSEFTVFDPDRNCITFGAPTADR
jgi:catechol 2,3-dioxygenase-like lactoylglutathione lyase family enzyme